MRCPWFIIAALVAILFVSACQTNPAKVDSEDHVHANYSPALESDEAGLWLIMDRAEEKLKTSGQVITDEEPNRYLREVVCNLAQDLCPDIRIYLVKTPYFNATMAPNGVMQVWSGLLLRAENEAQLAYILGHEIAHYREQHSLQLFRRAKSTASILLPFQLTTSAAGVGFVGSFAGLAAYGTMMKFSRNHERAADEGGLKMMVSAGYNPNEAAKIWEGLLKEREAMGDKVPFIFTSTHPSSKDRVNDLKKKATIALEPQDGWTLGTDRYRNVVDPMRKELLRDELRLRRFASTQVILDRLRQSGASSPDIDFFQAKLYSMRAKEGDLEKAEDTYRKCLEGSQPPVEGYRELAMIYMKTERPHKATPLFETYLQLQPDAFDSKMVESYIQRMHSTEPQQ